MSVSSACQMLYQVPGSHDTPAVCMQLAGDNLLRVVPAFAAELAGGAAQRPRGSKNASAYMDFLGFFMVRLHGA